MKYFDDISEQVMQLRDRKAARYMSLLFIPLLLIVTFDRAGAQQSAADSLEKAIAASSAMDTARVNKLCLYSRLALYYYPAKADDAAEYAYKLAERLRYTAGMAEARLRLAKIAIYIGHHDEAINCATESASLFNEIHDKRGAVQARITLGNANLLMNRGDEARHIFTECFRWCTSSNFKKGIADALSGLARTYQSTDKKKALAMLKRCLSLYQELDDKHGIAATFMSCCLVDSYPRAAGKGLDYLEKGLPYALETGDKQMLAVYMINLGADYSANGAHQEALDFYESGFRHAREIDNKRIMSDALENIGLLKSRLLQFDEALTVLNHALKLAEELEDRRRIGRIRLAIGNAFLKTGEYDKASRILETLLQAREISKDTARVINLLLGLGVAQRKSGHRNEALKYYLRALPYLPYFERMADETKQAEIYIDLGQEYENIGEFEISLEYLEKGLKLSEKNGRTNLAAQTMYLIGAVLGDKSPYEKAFKSSYEKALEYLFGGLHLSEQLADTGRMVKIWARLAGIYEKLCDYDRAVKYSRMCLPYLEAAGTKDEYVAALRIHGELMFNTGNYDSAFVYLFRSKGICERLGNKMELGVILVSVGVAYECMQDSRTALEYYDQAITLFEETGENRHLATALQNAAKTHAILKEYAPAIWCWERCKRLEAYATRQVFMHMEQGLSQTYSELGDYRNAYEHHSKYVQIKDSIDWEIHKASIDELSTKYENEKRKQKIALLEKEKQVQSLELLRRNNDLALQLLEAGRNREGAALAARERDLNVLELARRSSELESSRKDLEMQKAEQDRKAVRIAVLSKDVQVRESDAAKAGAFRSMLLAGLGLSLVVGFLGYKRIQAKKTEATLRAESAEYQAQVAEYQVKASEAGLLRLQAETERNRREAQQEFSRRLIEEQENERKRIAAELHNRIGRDLQVIRNKALAGMNGADAKQEIRKILDAIADVASSSLQEVRTISRDLRPHQLERLGLTETIRDAMRAVTVSSGISLTADVADIDGLFPKEGEINVYRIVQECVNNIIRHSAATEAMILVLRDADSARIVVEDNGRGFDPSAKPRGMGLKGIAERVRMLDGAMSLKSAPGQGTSMRVDLPVRALEAAYEAAEPSVTAMEENRDATG
jgi:signal transduction histidine kinase